MTYVGKLQTFYFHSYWFIASSNCFRSKKKKKCTCPPDQDLHSRRQQLQYCFCPHAPPESPTNEKFLVAALSWPWCSLRACGLRCQTVPWLIFTALKNVHGQVQIPTDEARWKESCQEPRLPSLHPSCCVPGIPAQLNTPSTQNTGPSPCPKAES